MTLSEITLTQADKGTSVTIGPGEGIRITLGDNPSTGFRWAVEGADNAILELVGSDYVPSAGVAPGAGGQHVWRFKAKNAGEARLAFKRWRSWEGESSVVERLEFVLHVKEN